MTKDDRRMFDEVSFDRAVLRSPMPVLVEFGATWCPPCKALAPVVHALANEHHGRLEVGEVNVEDSPSLAVRFGVRAVPTLVVFAGGIERARHVGLASRAKIVAMLDGVVARSDDAASSLGTRAAT
jgi:thioredoxin 1